MKIRLLNCGGYLNFGEIEFPLIVDGIKSESDKIILVKGKELLMAGFGFMDPKHYYAFSTNDPIECEIIND